MAKRTASPVPVTAKAERDTDDSAVPPLTRGGYERLPICHQQIESAVRLSAPMLLDRARKVDLINAEALVFFIRRAHRSGDTRMRDALFEELFRRCIPFFRGKIRGFSDDTRKDIQGAVMKEVAEDVMAAGDQGDFMQVRFWVYLGRKTIDACRIYFKNSDETESLESSYSGETTTEGQTKLDGQIDRQLSPEQLAMLAEGLQVLPPKLRQVFILRHYVGMQVGPDGPAPADSSEVTLAGQFNCTGRTIRKWLKEADSLLAVFREKDNDDE